VPNGDTSIVRDINCIGQVEENCTVLDKHKSLGIKPHIAHSMYKDSWVQDKHRQNSNKDKPELRQKSNNKTLIKPNVCALTPPKKLN